MGGEPIVIEERHDSRRLTTGPSPQLVTTWNIYNSDDEVAVRQALVDQTPLTYDPFGTGLFALFRSQIAIEPIAPQHWYGDVRYGSATPQTDSGSFSFDTAGGTQHITHTKQTVGAYPPGAAPDNKGTIGGTPSGVEGTDIIVPVFNFSVTRYRPKSEITTQYVNTLYLLTGRVNSEPFSVDVDGITMAFAAGECLFRGASGGRRRGVDDWELQYQLSASPNVTNLQVGDITGISKYGWEYLWIRYKESKDENTGDVVKVPAAVFIEQVYLVGDLNALAV